MQGRNWILLATAAVIGMVAVIVANAWFSGMESGQDTMTTSEQGSARIVVATQPLGFGAVLSEQNVRLAAWPAGSVPQGAFLTLEQALQDNRVALRPIVPGEPVLADKVSGADGRATLAALLTPGMRAVSVSVDAIRGVSGFVLPGTVVDVLLTRRMGGPGASNDDLRTDVILENVQVLAVDQVSDERQGEPRVSQTVTLAVSLSDAQRLALAGGLGTVSLALRNHSEIPFALTEENQALVFPTVTAGDLGGRNLFIPVRQTAQPVPVTTTFVNPRPAAVNPRPAAEPAPRLPEVSARPARSMVVVRGTQATIYPVSRLGGE